MRDAGKFRGNNLYKSRLVACVLALPIVASGSLAGYAAEINGVSKISSVMVFPSGAQVTRSFSVDLPAGEHQLILNDLPAGVQGNSIRLEGSGLGSLEIGSLDHKVLTQPLRSSNEQATIDLLKEEVLKLQDERIMAQASVDAAALQLKLLNEMALLPSRPLGHINGGAQTSNVDPSVQYSNLYSLMGDKYVEANANALKARIKLRELDKQIKNLNARISEQPRENKRVTRLTVNVLAGTAGKADFTVQYQIGGARWWPVYDGRLKTDDGAGNAKLELVRRAVIQQNTSEDWNNVKLSLSTTNPTGQVKAPELFAWLIDFKKPPILRKPAGARKMELSDDVAESDRYQNMGRLKSRAPVMLEAPVPVAASQKSAIVNSSQFQMTFDVTGETTVLRNGERKKVLLDKFEIVPDIKLRAVPKKIQKAFLHASFENKTGNVLIPGEISLFRDGVYVGRSSLQLVEPNQVTEVGFGVDPKVNVKWVRADRLQGKTGLLTSSNSDVRKYKITIVNGHEREMDVTVLDQMPYSENEALQVSLQNSSPKPDRSDVDDLRGVMAWDLKIEPQKAKVIEFGYEVIWPKDKSITLR